MDLQHQINESYNNKYKDLKSLKNNKSVNESTVNESLLIGGLIAGVCAACFLPSLFGGKKGKDDGVFSKIGGLLGIGGDDKKGKDKDGDDGGYKSIFGDLFGKPDIDPHDMFGDVAAGAIKISKNDKSTEREKAKKENDDAEDLNALQVFMRATTKVDENGNVMKDEEGNPIKMTDEEMKTAFKDQFSSEDEMKEYIEKMNDAATKLKEAKPEELEDFKKSIDSLTPQDRLDSIKIAETDMKAAISERKAREERDAQLDKVKADYDYSVAVEQSSKPVDQRKIDDITNEYNKKCDQIQTTYKDTKASIKAEADENLKNMVFNHKVSDDDIQKMNDKIIERNAEIDANTEQAKKDAKENRDKAVKQLTDNYINDKADIQKEEEDTKKAAEKAYNEKIKAIDAAREQALKDNDAKKSDEERNKIDDEALEKMTAAEDACIEKKNNAKSEYESKVAEADETYERNTRRAQEDYDDKMKSLDGERDDKHHDIKSKYQAQRDTAKQAYEAAINPKPVKDKDGNIKKDENGNDVYTQPTQEQKDRAKRIHDEKVAEADKKESREIEDYDRDVYDKKKAQAETDRDKVLIPEKNKRDNAVNAAKEKKEQVEHDTDEEERTKKEEIEIDANTKKDNLGRSKSEIEEEYGRQKDAAKQEKETAISTAESTRKEKLESAKNAYKTNVENANKTFADQVEDAKTKAESEKLKSHEEVKDKKEKSAGEKKHDEEGYGQEEDTDDENFNDDETGETDDLGDAEKDEIEKYDAKNEQNPPKEPPTVKQRKNKRTGKPVFYLSDDPDQNSIGKSGARDARRRHKVWQEKMARWNAEHNG